MLYPEGKKISYTISKKIILARAIIKKPKLLILEDSLDQFEPKEANKIIDYLSHPSHKWALIVVSRNKRFEAVCNDTIELKEGKII